MRYLVLFISFTVATSYIFAQGNCASINATGGNGQINISGITGAATAGVQVFNSSWGTVFSQTYTNPPSNIVVSPIAAGSYFVNVRLFNSDWSTICEKGINVTVSENTPPPGDSCTNTYQKLFGDPQYDEYGNDIVKTRDGGYVIVGKAGEMQFSRYNALFSKYNEYGHPTYNHKYGGSREDWFTSVKMTAEGGFICAGVTKSDGQNLNGDAWLLRNNEAGVLQWQKRYTDDQTPALVHEVIQTSEGGFAFVGNFPFEVGLSDWMVVKTDASGNIQWQKKVGTSGTDEAFGLVEDHHGGAGLVVSGSNRSTTTYDANLTKFDLSNGNILWTKSYDVESKSNSFKRIYLVTDGFIISGGNNHADGINLLYQIVKTDFNGNVVFVKEYKVTDCQDGNIAVFPDGGIMLTAGEFPNNPSSDIRLIRTDASGNILWAKKYPRPERQWLNRIIPDGNLLVGAGYARAGLYQDILLFKSDLLGKAGDCSWVDETVTVRTPILTNINFTWPTNVNLNLTATNTSYKVSGHPEFETFLCGDTCITPLPSFSISTVPVNESVVGARFEICLSSPSTQEVSIRYSSVNGSAVAGSDYTAQSNVLTFLRGQTCAIQTIPILNDTVVEPTESFTIILSDPVGATIANGTGTITINDDDPMHSQCNGISISTGPQLIRIDGLTAPVATVQIFNSGWAMVFNQTYTNSPGMITVPFEPGLYHVRVSFYTSGWSFICDKNHDVTVVSGCPAGTICISNTCPSQTVNLNTAYSIPNLPAGTMVSWHTGTPATDVNKLTPSQAQNVSTSGTFYAAINISGANCYSATIPVNVTITSCTSSALLNAIELESASNITRKIMVFPNPFTRSVRVIIDSEKKEKASLVLTDLLGRRLRILPVQLVPGSNTFLIEGLEQYPSGNYFLSISSANEMKTIKLMRQQ